MLYNLIACENGLTQSCLLPLSKKMLVGRARGWSTWIFAPFFSFFLNLENHRANQKNHPVPWPWLQKCSQGWGAGSDGCENQQPKRSPYCLLRGNLAPATVGLLKQEHSSRSLQNVGTLNWRRPLPVSPIVSTSIVSSWTNTRFFPMSPTKTLPLLYAIDL